MLACCAPRARDASWWCWAPGVPPRPSAPAGAAKELPSVLRKIEKWGDYEPFGAPVRVRGGAGIIPMKTPLTVAQMRRLASSGKRIRNAHTLEACVASHAAAGRRIGLIVDLTCHDCLYAEELPLVPGTRYVHLATPAKTFVEPWLVRKLAREADALWAADPAAYVAVHCSYGFNRTGFALCCYLVEIDGLGVDAALDRFRDARPPGVKHAHFVAELHRRYDPPNPSPAVTVPDGPDAPKPGDESAPGSLSTTPVDGVGSPLIRRCAASRPSPSRKM